MRIPVRASTWVLSGVVQGTSDSRQATWTGSSAEFTRASTAMSVGSTPDARQASITSTARPANWSLARRSTSTGPDPASSPDAGAGGSVRPSGLRIVFTTRSWLYESRWRAASTTPGGQR